MDAPPPVVDPFAALASSGAVAWSWSPGGGLVSAPEEAALLASHDLVDVLREADEAGASVVHQLLGDGERALAVDGGRDEGGVWHGLARRLSISEATERTNATARAVVEATTDQVFVYRLEPAVYLGSPSEQRRDAVWNARLVLCNGPYAKAHGAADPSELVGRRLSDLTFMSRRTVVRHFDRLLALGGELIEPDLPLDDGGGRHLGLKLVALIEHGRVEVVWGSLRDTTARHRAERAESRAQAQLGLAQRLETVAHVAGSISHEFNNLLAAIQGNAELLAEELASASPVARQAVADIVASAARGGDLTRRLLGFSHGDQAERRPVQIREALAHLHGTLLPLVPGATTLTLAPDAGATHAVVLADPVQLEQLLVQLVANARDAVGEAGHIRITHGVAVPPEPVQRRFALAARPHVQLVVEDDGHGIPAHDLERIFEPFFTTRPADTSPGLGLAIAWSIVREHGGGIDVHSVAGEGTRVSVWLPRADALTPVPSEPEAPVVHRVTEARVLVADDEPLLRRLARLTLTRAGLEVVTAPDGEAAWEAFAAEPDAFDVLVLDTLMPGLTGAQVHERVQELRPGQRTLFVSGFTRGALGHIDFEAPHVDFLAKPFGPNDLVQAVFAMVGQQELAAR